MADPMVWDASQLLGGVMVVAIASAVVLRGRAIIPFALAFLGGIAGELTANQTAEAARDGQASMPMAVGAAVGLVFGLLVAMSMRSARRREVRP